MFASFASDRAYDTVPNLSMRPPACNMCASTLRRQLRAVQRAQQQLGFRWQSSEAGTSASSSSGSTSHTSSRTTGSSREDASVASMMAHFTRSKLSVPPFQSTSSSTTSTPLPPASIPILDPLKLVGSELSSLRSNVQRLLGSGHPALDTIAKYYFQAEGKHIRPLIVLLMSQATNGLAPGFEARLAMELSGQKQGDVSRGIDDPLETRDDILSDANPSISTSTSTFPSDSSVLPSQRRLAEITEMIHVASLLHDDVIDASDTRRAQPSAPSAYGNKLSILGGDFLLARASLYLSRLGSNEVVELVASVLANLVEGEIMQIKGNTPEGALQAVKLTPEIFQHYLKKTYLKTASLVAKSARATTVLGGAGEKQGWVDGERIKDIAYAYGRNLGIAFQVRADSSPLRLYRC